MKKFAIFILTSLIIGNGVAWIMGAWPINFEHQPYTTQEKQTLTELNKELKNNPQDADLLIELGALYSMHNEIELAKTYLNKAINIKPDDPLAQAWDHANAAKLSGASLDFTMGLYKLYTLNKSLSGITQALELAPDDLNIRLIRLATFSAIGKINPDFALVFDDELWFQQLIAKNSQSIPPEVKGQFYISMAQAHLLQNTNLSDEKVQYYLNLYQEISNKSAQNIAQFQLLEIKLASADRGHIWK